jgi:hypothetical protein
MEEELRPVSRTIKVFYRIFQRRTGQEVIDLAESDPVGTARRILSRFSFGGEPSY